MEFRQSFNEAKAGQQSLQFAGRGGGVGSSGIAFALHYTVVSVLLAHLLLCSLPPNYSLASKFFPHTDFSVLC